MNVRTISMSKAYVAYAQRTVSVVHPPYLSTGMYNQGTLANSTYAWRPADERIST